MAENVGNMEGIDSGKIKFRKVDNVGTTVANTQTTVVHPLENIAFDKGSLHCVNGGANTVTYKVWVCNFVWSTPVSITAITQANPGVITAASHGIASGSPRICRIGGINGMTEIPNGIYQLTYVSANTASIQNATTAANIDTSAYTAYTDGGAIELGPPATITKAEGWAHLSNYDITVTNAETEAVWWEGEWDYIAVTGVDGGAGSGATQNIYFTQKRVY